MKKIILASASPRRRQLLMQAGLDFEVCASKEEEKTPELGPEDTVRMLSRIKAESVERQRCLTESEKRQEHVVIGADTVVACSGRILGKPKDDEDALRMLRMLQGRTHQVYTGVTIIERKDGRRSETTFAEKTDVEMYPATDEQLRAYIATGECADKAGAYAIQGRAAVFVRKINGDYNNVVGLPVAAVWQYFQNKEQK